MAFCYLPVKDGGYPIRLLAAPIVRDGLTVWLDMVYTLGHVLVGCGAVMGGGLSGWGRGERGATVVEYAFLVSLIAVVVVVVVMVIGNNVRGKFELLESEITRMQQGS